jgi:hypothetical protein
VLELSGIVCMDPLHLGGLKGKKSTPSIGWDVLVRSHRLSRRIWMESMHWEDILASSSLVKVCLLKLLLVIKFNIHLFILLYSEDDFISMRFLCTCISCLRFLYSLIAFFLLLFSMKKVWMQIVFLYPNSFIL